MDRPATLAAAARRISDIPAPSLPLAEVGPTARSRPSHLAADAGLGLRMSELEWGGHCTKSEVRIRQKRRAHKERNFSATALLRRPPVDRRRWSSAATAAGFLPDAGGAGPRDRTL